MTLGKNTVFFFFIAEINLCLQAADLKTSSAPSNEDIKSDKLSWEQLWTKLSRAVDLTDLQFLSLERSRFDRSLSTEEISILWGLSSRLYIPGHQNKKNSIKHSSKHSTDFDVAENFERLLAVYFAGIVIGQNLFALFHSNSTDKTDPSNPEKNRSPEGLKNLNFNESFTEAFDLSLSTYETKMKALLKETRRHFSGQEQFSQFVSHTLYRIEHSDNLLALAKDQLSSKELKAFYLSVASEYAIDWIEQYTTQKVHANDNPCQIYLYKLLQLPAKILVLAGQRLLAQHKQNSLKNAFALLVMACEKKPTLKTKLKYLIENLIQAQQADIFEDFAFSHSAHRS